MAVVKRGTTVSKKQVTVKYATGTTVQATGCTKQGIANTEGTTKQGTTTGATKQGAGAEGKPPGATTTLMQSLQLPAWKDQGIQNLDNHIFMFFYLVIMQTQSSTA